MKLLLTPELVDSLSPPTSGEKWISDNDLQHFGLRMWSGKNGGGKAFAIRMRDSQGRLVRETFDPTSDRWMYYTFEQWREADGYFLKPAREWARDRIRFHLGLPTSEQISAARWEKRRRRILATKLNDAFEARLKNLRSRTDNQEYIDHIQNLMAQQISPAILASTFADVSIRGLADAISREPLSGANVRVLRAFVGSVFKDAARQFGPLGRKLDLIQRRCVQNRDARKLPPHPAILEISSDDYQRFFAMLDDDPDWRAALAIRLYFSTGAKLQQILKARWSDMVGREWYPFVPAQRKLWYESHQRLDDEAMRIIERVRSHHQMDDLRSPFLFPSAIKGPDFSIASVQRFWGRKSGTMGWQNLPLSHVVLRHRPRDNPSYSLDFYRSYLNFDKVKVGIPSLSKVVKRRKDSSFNAITYAVDR